MEKCNDQCMLAGRVDRLEKDMAEEKKARQESHKEFYRRIRDLENNQAVNQEKLETIEGKIDGMDGKLDTLLAKPGKRWESIVAAVVSALVAGIMGFFLAGLGVG